MVNPKTLIDKANELSYVILPYQKRLAALEKMKTQTEVSLLSGQGETVPVGMSRIIEIIWELERDCQEKIDKATEEAMAEILNGRPEQD